MIKMLFDTTLLSYTNILLTGNGSVDRHQYDSIIMLENGVKKSTCYIKQNQLKASNKYVVSFLLHTTRPTQYELIEFWFTYASPQ